MATSAVFSAKPAFAGRARATPAAVRNVAVRASTAQRQIWFPGNTDTVPSYLDGTLPGDYGFDPLRLGSDPEILKWMTHAEIFHGRVAMMGAAGIIIPGLLTKAGLLNVPEWYLSGKVAIEEQNINLTALLIVEFFLAGWVELKRWYDIRNPGSQGDGSFFGITDGFKPQGNGYPGGVFDPLGFASGSPDAVHELKVKEIKNGRLAMLANLGFWAQYAATGKGPIDNLFDHLADPGHVNFATNGISIPYYPNL